jgi:hypothetical protein
MKGFTEQRGACARLVYDEVAKAFVLKSIPHPYAMEQPVRLEGFHANETAPAMALRQAAE